MATEPPDWVKRSLELFRQALQEVARKRGKSLKVYKGLDMRGI